MLRSRASGEGGGAAPIRARLPKARNLRIATLPLIGERNWHLLIAGSRGAATSQPQFRTRINASQHRPFHRRFSLFFLRGGRGGGWAPPNPRGGAPPPPPRRRTPQRPACAPRPPPPPGR